MTVLIPNYAPNEPPGEVRVFGLFERSTLPWTVIHSLDLCPWNRSRRTEIDFLAIIPSHGLMCLEVKSHEGVHFDGRQWFPRSIEQNPFDQAMNARKTLERRIRQQRPELSDIPISHCLIFTHADFEVREGLEVSPWHLIDQRALDQFRHPDLFGEDLIRRLELELRHDGSLSQLRRPMDGPTVQAILDFCLPVRRRVPTPREELARRADQMERHLREQQQPVLKLHDRNDRILVDGPAGTGKTLIAEEIALRDALTGRRTALLCFNNLIGNHLKDRATSRNPSPPNLVVGTVHKVLMDLLEIEVTEAASPSFWDEQFVEMALDRLTNPNFQSAAAFDSLVIDEAQDLLARPGLWSCVQQLARGGIADGRVAIFGDFEHQVLGDRATVRQELDSFRASAHPAEWSLTENCRNYRGVGDLAERVARHPLPVYEGFRRGDGPLECVNFRTYSNRTDQLAKLQEVLKSAAERGFDARSICILTCAPAKRPTAAAELAKGGWRLNPASTSAPTTRFCDVRAFKGMEARMIIITDIDLNACNDPDLLFTAITRTTEEVTLLAETDAAKELAQLLR